MDGLEEEEESDEYTYTMNVYAGEVIRISYEAEGDWAEDYVIDAVTGDLQAAAPWYRWADEDALQADDLYSDLDVAD